MSGRRAPPNQFHDSWGCSNSALCIRSYGRWWMCGVRCRAQRRHRFVVGMDKGHLVVQYPYPGYSDVSISAVCHSNLCFKPLRLSFCTLCSQTEKNRHQTAILISGVIRSPLTPPTRLKDKTKTKTCPSHSLSFPPTLGPLQFIIVLLTLHISNFCSGHSAHCTLSRRSAATYGD